MRIKRVYVWKAYTMLGTWSVQQEYWPLSDYFINMDG